MELNGKKYYILRNKNTGNYVGQSGNGQPFTTAGGALSMSGYGSWRGNKDADYELVTFELTEVSSDSKAVETHRNDEIARQKRLTAKFEKAEKIRKERAKVIARLVAENTLKLLDGNFDLNIEKGLEYTVQTSRSNCNYGTILTLRIESIIKPRIAGKNVIRFAGKKFDYTFNPQNGEFTKTIVGRQRPEILTLTLTNS